MIREHPRPRNLRLARHAALAIAVVLGLAGIFQHGLWTPDEPREAEVGREMLLSGFSPLPTLGGAPFVEKPPLFPWVMSAGYRVFGVSPAVARLPAWLFGVGAVLVAFELGRRAGGRLAGLAAALVLATTVKFADVSHASVNDVALTFFVASDTSRSSSRATTTASVGDPSPFRSRVSARASRSSPRPGSVRFSSPVRR